MRIPTVAALVALSGLVAACQSPDVGQDCQFTNSLDSAASVPADFAATGITVCENLVCIRSPSRPTAYCSKPCVANSDCSQSETGLICRELTFDANFMATLPPEVQAQYQRVLGPIGLSNYCATPQQ
jgi:hypothetical protein